MLYINMVNNNLTKHIYVIYNYIIYLCRISSFINHNILYSYYVLNAHGNLIEYTPNIIFVIK